MLPARSRRVVEMMTAAIVPIKQRAHEGVTAGRYDIGHSCATTRPFGRSGHPRIYPLESAAAIDRLLLDQAPTQRATSERHLSSANQQEA